MPNPYYADLLRQSHEFWARPAAHNQRSIAGPTLDVLRWRARRRRAALRLRMLVAAMGRAA